MRKNQVNILIHSLWYSSYEVARQIFLAILLFFKMRNSYIVTLNILKVRYSNIYTHMYNVLHFSL